MGRSSACVYRCEDFRMSGSAHLDNRHIGTHIDNVFLLFSLKIIKKMNKIMVTKQ